MYAQTKIKRLTLCAMLITLSVVIGMVCKLYLTFGAIRFTFENFGILFVGYIFGPLYGLAAGLLTDIITCIVTAQPFNPLICLGAGAVGLICGLVSHGTKKHGLKRLAVSVMSAHAVGNMLIKSIGLCIYFGFSPEVAMLRIPLYLIIGVCELLLIHIVIKNKEINKHLEGLR